ncbi:MAG: hypothetical protein QNJ64_15435 [Crocosphaera sp.]|nr:hypothetical protein [Crocosphaera sp.]
MSNMIIELLTMTVMVIAIGSKLSQAKTEVVVIPVPVDDKIRKS